MKKLFPALAIHFFVVSSLFCQENVEVFGYLESQIMGIEIGGEMTQLHTNKLRVDLQSDLSDNITFAANFDYITYHGKTVWNILDLTPTSG